MEKRRHQRMEINNLDVDISDGLGFFNGTISDLSRFGMKVNNISKRFDDNAKRLSVVVTDKGKNFKMKARPRWSVRLPMCKMIGIEITNAPWGWTEFVINFEPQRDDVWGDITI
jgi:hypothetical protein